MTNVGSVDFGWRIADRGARGARPAFAGLVIRLFLRWRSGCAPGLLAVFSILTCVPQMNNISYGCWLSEKISAQVAVESRSFNYILERKNNRSHRRPSTYLGALLCSIEKIRQAGYLTNIFHYRAISWVFHSIV